MEKILFRSAGGFGKQIMATAVARMVREQYPDAIIHVQTSYPEAFANLDFIDRYFPLNNVPYFYEEHKDFEILECEPYLSLQFRQGEEHLIESWCKKLNLDAPSHLQGIIKLDEAEEDVGKQWKVQAKIDRPLVAFQPFGGTSYYDPNQATNKMRPRQYRDIKLETAQEIVDGLVDKGFAVLQIGLPTEPKLKNCVHLPENVFQQARIVFSFINACDYAIGIDSFMQHVWSALGKTNMLVLWGGTNPECLGYKTNINKDLGKESCKSLFCGRPNTFLFDFRGNGSPWKCIKNGKCMGFKSKDVIKMFSKDVLKEKKKDTDKKKKK